MLLVPSASEARYHDMRMAIDMPHSTRFCQQQEPWHDVSRHLRASRRCKHLQQEAKEPAHIHFLRLPQLFGIGLARLAEGLVCSSVVMSSCLAQELQASSSAPLALYKQKVHETGTGCL